MGKLQAALLWTMTASCTTVAGLGDLTFTDGGGPGGGGTGGVVGGEGGVGGDASGGSGGDGAHMSFCMDALDCETQHGQVAACTRWTCLNAECQILDEPAGTPCTASGGTVCDGSGACVECTMNSHCADGTCQASTCVDASCEDDVQSTGETDVDCGGPCGPCNNGRGCLVDTDCLSLVCGGTTCQACAAHNDCPDNSYYCDLNGDLACHPLKPCFAPCMYDYECVDGDCIGTCF